MKFFATLLISALAATVASAADAPACDPSLAQVALGADGSACTAATGFSAATLKVPAGEVLAKVCGNPSCQKLLAAVTKAVPTECMFAGVPVKATLIDKFPAACAAALKVGSGATNATATTAPNAASGAAANATAVSGAAANATAAANTTKPVATTKAPMVTMLPSTGSTDKSGSSDIEEVEVTMSPSSMAGDEPAKAKESPTTVPAPAPTSTKKSAATTIVAATSAVLMAAAATLL